MLTSSSRSKGPAVGGLETVWACAETEWEKTGLVILRLNMSEGEERVLVASLKIGCFEGLRVVASSAAAPSRSRDRMVSWVSVRGRVEGTL